jgi:hypothetical protein
MGTRVDAGQKQSHAAINFFIVFVDATFTIFVRPLFTKPFEAIAPSATFPCVYRACNPD